MLQSRAVPGKSRFLEKARCCRAEQFLDSLDFWKRRDAADQSSSGIEWVPGKDGMLQSRKGCGAEYMWKEEKNSFTFFNMFFSYKNGSETLCTVC